MGNEELLKAVSVVVDKAVVDLVPTIRRIVLRGVVAGLTEGDAGAGLVSLADSLPEPGELHRAPRGRPPKQLSVKQAAERADVSVRVIYNALAKGKLCFVEVDVPEGTRGPRNGKLKTISLADLTEWMKAHGGD